MKLEIKKNKPVLKASCGCIKMAVWKNGEPGKEFYTLSMEKIYKDGADFKSCKTYGINDIAKIQSCLSYIYDKMTLKIE